MKAARPKPSRSVSRLLLAAFTLSEVMFLVANMATIAVAQITPGTFKHIIIVVQENRTPDNLFGAVPSSTVAAGTQCSIEDPFMTGVDIENGGPNKTLGGITCNMALPLNGWDSDLLPSNSPPAQPVGAIDPDHSYDGDGNYPNGWGWVYDFDFNTSQQVGYMDGFCHGTGYVPGAPHPCPSYSYVPLGGDPNNYDNGDITPYYNIAQNYGFGNYMFQTHEGPSFEAHQFLFTGTSAPVAPGYNNNEGQWDLDFVAELSGTNYGCQETGDGPNWVYPNGNEFGGDPSIGECYAHDSLVTAAADCPPNNEEGYCDRLVGGIPITWGYYQQAGGSIWDAAEANPQSCYGSSGPQNWATCPDPAPPQYTEYSTHVHIANVNGHTSAPIFDDLANCSLPQISWVIPDGQWSDHPYGQTKGVSQKSFALGPFWVGDIIDAVGQGMVNSTCNPYTPGGGYYWTKEPTAVIVTWDDWGGWYDHIPPWAFYGLGKLGKNGQPIGGWDGTSWYCGDAPSDPPNGWGCGYVSGFRVPLLVVSAWTGQNINGTITNYVSGACGPGTKYATCPNPGPNNEYVHDFGSILAFTEWNFGMPNIDQSGDNGYADLNAPDVLGGKVGLWDFFQLTAPRQFVPVSVTGNLWPYACFQNWGTKKACNGTTGTYVPVAPDAY